MKCSNCGAEVTENTRFCAYCGTKIDETNMINSMSSNNGTDKLRKVKSKFLCIWNNLSKFGKIAAIGITVFVVLGLVAFLADRIFAGILAVVQIAIMVVAILMKKQIIKVTKTWIPLLAIALSFVLIFPFFALFKVNLADYEKYAWNEVVLADMLPKPESPYGEIIVNYEDYLFLDVTKTSEEQYGKYIEACKNKGFTIDIETTETFFDAYNDKGFKLSLSYYDNEMHIVLDDAIELSNITWPNSDIAKLLPIPKSNIGNIQQDDEKGFVAYIGETSIEEYNAYVKACEDKGFTVDANKTEKSYSAKNIDAYELSVEYKGNNVIYLSIDKTDESSENPESKIITITMGEDDFKGMDYKEAEKKFREMGFTKFEYETVDTEDKSEADGTICYIEITEIFIGDSDFSKGDKFNSDSTVTFYSYKYEAPKPVFYSTNDYETAKKGNTGVFSYKNKSGSYDVYWIIDFDEGYVYSFTEGNGESTCDRVKIVSGHLNDKVTVTWHDGGDQWSWYLHFKYVDSPATLVVNDHNGFPSEFTTTDLDDALALRNSKTIINY